MNIETVAKAICRADQDMEGDYSWEVQFEDGRESYRNMARAARDAHFVLSDYHWQTKRGKVARAIFDATQAAPLELWPGLSSELKARFYQDADAAMLALGFRRADQELTS